MNKDYRFLSVLLIATLVAGCSSLPQSAFLEEARSNFVVAQGKPDVANYAAVELSAASEALQAANKAQERKEDQEVVDHLGYLARQKVAIAEEIARTKAAEAALSKATAERDALRLEARTAEADAAKRQAEMAQQKSNMTAEELARVEEEARNKERELAAAQEEARKKEAELAAATQNAEQDKARLSEVEKQLQGLKTQKTERGLVITLGDVLFDTNKAELKPGGMRSVEKLAQFLQENPQHKVLVEGFTDSVGSEEHNLVLSDRRANAVREKLMSMGISSDRIATRGYGEEFPVSSNDNPAVRQLNRRVEIILSDSDSDIEPR